MEIVLWLTVVVIAALLLLLMVTMWRSWRRRVPPVFSPGTVGNPVGSERVEIFADAEGPVGSQYPPGGRPAGPGAEGMAVSSPGEIVPGWNVDVDGEADGVSDRTSDGNHPQSSRGVARGITRGVDS